MPTLPAPSPLARRPAEVRGMFDAIAPRYDLVNRILSAGLDQAWRRRLVSLCALPVGARVADVCCGTGALSRAFAAAGASPVGADFSAGMLARGGGEARVRGDALLLPFRDGAFDAAACAFGLRNTEDWAAAVRELARVVRPGGTVAVLDFGMPRAPGLSGLYRLYLRHVLPRTAGLLSREGAYRYLQASVELFDRTADLEGTLKAAGCLEIRRTPMTMGVAVAWVARR